MIISIVCSAVFSLVCIAYAQDLVQLKIEYGAVCKDVVERSPVGESTSFSSDVGKLYCFTTITGAAEPTEVVHVWYYGEQEMARVPLAVKSPRWRTYSSKLIRPGDTGPWKVVITDRDGNKLEAYHFLIFEGNS